MNYKQLTQEQRYQIYVLLKAEHTKTEISSILGVHKSTVPIIGKNNKQAIVTLTEHKTKLLLMKRVKQKTAGNVAKAIIELLKPISQYVHTIT